MIFADILDPMCSLERPVFSFSYSDMFLTEAIVKLHAGVGHVPLLSMPPEKQRSPEEAMVTPPPGFSIIPSPPDTCGPPDHFISRF